MKYLIWPIFLTLFFTATYGQKRLTLEKGEIAFTSNAALEIIKANSKSIRGIIDLTDYKFAIKVPIKSFTGFNTELQREHFNENYLESDAYPNAIFAGKFIETIDFQTDGTYEINTIGDLEMHGVKQNRIIKIKIIIKNGIIAVGTKFKVLLTDHNIQIPKIVNQKIATEIDVNFLGTLKFQK